MLSIAQFGTFEVENYGDRLFPLILEKELALRFPAFKLQLFSPLTEPNSKTIKPILNSSSLFSLFSPDAIMIGGGDIISFSNQIAACYQQKWPYKMSPHTACWAVPSIQRPSGIPIIWNAPGVPFKFTHDQAILVRTLAAEVDYLSVRDEISLSHLREAGVKQEIAVVPDTAILLPKYFPAEELKSKAMQILQDFNLAIGEPILFQMHPAISEKLIPTIVSVLRQLKTKLKRPVLLLPIGYCHQDHDILYKVKEASKGEFLLIEENLDPISITSLIAHSSCFIGTSLHGNIAAFAYQIPHVIYNGSSGLAKLKGFAQLIQEEERCISDLQDLLSQSSLLLKKPSSQMIKKLSHQVNLHFDHIEKIILQAHSNYTTHLDPSLLENYIQLIYDIQSYKDQLNQIYHSNAWQLISMLKKTIFQVPFAKFIFNRLFSSSRKDVLAKE